jgi:hypothetical protein
MAPISSGVTTGRPYSRVTATTNPQPKETRMTGHRDPRVEDHIRALPDRQQAICHQVASERD